jgi:secondary thiamine-phosphate synthase enzyme
VNQKWGPRASPAGADCGALSLTETYERTQYLIFLISPCISRRKQRQQTLKQSVHNLEISTRGQSLYEVTSTINEWVTHQSMQTGLLTIFCRHTSASLLIQENADPTVRSDIEAYFDRLAPGDGRYSHDSEGPDDMAAHLRTALTQVQLSIPVIDGGLRARHQERRRRCHSGTQRLSIRQIDWEGLWANLAPHLGGIHCLPHRPRVVVPPY